ncbi:MAG: RsmB/NOP family class I SAM-dependent RNA methyltransferase [Saccharofermentanales bacterium]
MNRTRLPALFLENMRELFGRIGRAEEYEAFILSFEQRPWRGIRFNSLKVDSSVQSEQILQEISSSAAGGFLPSGIPWSDDGYYLPDGTAPGKHPYYHAGIFYIQEPSAMLPAMLLHAEPGEAVLDLCAAPGGKSVKIAADMACTGILVSNDISSDRVKALVRNIELQGCSNCIVTNETPANLAARFIHFFDKILIDAPCSGEGMFRRDENAVRSWEKFGNDSCTAMQRDILGNVDAMLKPGGILVYSTCTFSESENEEMIAEFIRLHPDYSVRDLFAEGSLLSRITGLDGPVRGCGEHADLVGTCRIFPHISGGEGHYCAVLVKNKASGKEELRSGLENHAGSLESVKKSIHKVRPKTLRAGTEEFGEAEFIESFSRFARNTLSDSGIAKMNAFFSQHLKIYDSHAYTFNTPITIPDRINVVKKGLYLGEMKKTRSGTIFEPSHQLILSLRMEDITNFISFDPDNPFIDKYLKGETLFADPSAAGGIMAPGRYIAVCIKGYPLGWAKSESGGMIKNLYPKGWRRQN